MSPETKTIVHESAQNLAFAPGLEMMIELQGWGKRFKTLLLGFERGQYLIVRPPQQRLLLDSLAPRSTLTVRWIENGVIHGFQTQVGHLMFKPYKLLFLDYPYAVESIRLRKQERAQCYTPAVWFHDGAEYKGFILNISAGGLSLAALKEEAPENIPPGDEIVCQFPMFKTGVETVVAGIVKTYTPLDAKVLIGVAFNDLDDEIRTAVNEYVADVHAFLVG